MNWNALSDDELVARYQAGEETALKNLILRYERRLFSYLIVSVKNKEVAEDIFQDTFIKVINTIRSGNYHEEGKFFQWIMRIANNLKIDYYRRLQRMPTVDGGEEFDIFTIIGSRDESIEEKMIREQTYADLNHYVEYLPEELVKSDLCLLSDDIKSRIYMINTFDGEAIAAEIDAMVEVKTSR